MILSVVLKFQLLVPVLFSLFNGFFPSTKPFLNRAPQIPDSAAFYKLLKPGFYFISDTNTGYPRVLYHFKSDYYINKPTDSQVYFINPIPILTADDIADATDIMVFNYQAPELTITLNDTGRTKWAKIIRENPGKKYGLIAYNELWILKTISQNNLADKFFVKLGFNFQGELEQCARLQEIGNSIMSEKNKKK
jgi:hypothetical protein